MKSRELSKIDKEEEGEDDEEEGEKADEDLASSETSNEDSDKETDAESVKESADNATTEGNESTEVKPKSIMDTLNDYLEGIFSSEEEHDEEVAC